MTFDLPSLGWDGDLASSYRRFDLPDHLPGRVARSDVGVCTVLTETGALRASLGGRMLAAGARDTTTLPCVGDWVVVRTWPDERTTVEAVLPRRSAVVRAVAGKTSHGQALAANLDVAAVVEPLDPEPDLGRVERLLALAWESGARPVIVLTKCDTVADPLAEIEHIAETAPGIPVLAVSSTTGAGLPELLALTGPGRTLGLLGPSGAGKSTLVNTLAGATVMATREIRADGRGRHTTTHRALVPLPGGGVVIDTPGLRLVGMYDGAVGLDKAFTDIAELALTCRYGDCRHESEPGCAVRAALESGELAHRRLESWRKLKREQEREAARRDARLRLELRARWRRHGEERKHRRR